MNAFTTTRPSHRNPLCLAIASALVLFAGAASAQSASTDAAAAADTAVAQDGSTPPTSKPDGATTEFKAVIVTANKRPEDVRNVASSISVVSDEQLENINAGQLTDYANYVPGLQAASDGTPGQTRVSLRGIAPLSSGATVGTYIDETPVGSSGLYQAATILMLDLLPYDIDHLEVLRGPQGTLYGAGSMGGLLKYVTRAPDPSSTEFRIGGGVSSVSHGENGSNVRFGANVPLIDDKLAVRVSYARNNLPGYIDNPVNGEEDINDATQTSARAALLYQGDAFTLKLTALQQKIDSDNNATVSIDPATYQPIGGDLTHYVYVDSPFKKDVDYYAATLDWDLGWGDFTSATGYSKIDTMRRQDTTIDYGNVGAAYFGLDRGSSYFDTTLDFKQLTQEFRLASKSGGKLEWLVGTFYSKEEGNNRQFAALNQMDGTPFPPPYDAAVSDLATLALPTDFKEIAVFANASWQFTDRFKLGAGVRYAENDQNFVQDVTSGILLPIARTPNSSSENVFTWSLTPQFQISKDTLLYAKVATGYQPGGPNVKLPGVPDQVDSSTLISYEAGLKTMFADNRVQFDLSVFRLDWEDIQVAASFGGNTGLVNGGTARSQGIEFSSLFRPTTNLQLGFNAAYIDAELSDNFPTMVIPQGPYIVELTTGLSGDSMPYTPKLQYSLTADYFFPLGKSDWEGHIGGGYRWIDDRVNTTTQVQDILDAESGGLLDRTVTAPLRMDSYHSLDLYAGVENAHWSIRAYVKNATDERAYTTITDHPDQVTGEMVELVAAPIQPRTFGLEFDYRF
ncbi:TonB-dependent receptor [Pseudoxanthomonas indica]|uniref:Outer membrane receptor proteins, mostly Fe transport n=1 Tax=Pseudoxanthomonas indica TaxID=428993 RepID=A0A1T5LC54_9GAMM|nr:TonB-dependent receptor [Pseudoxanthomonas indica]GGD33361.1 TonB-dependent receptor [Pseudoxanthomonas indica]SKC73553.1 Outer membrane receptor proteins, mostly Fe transport [Pseudoxanthomonas indica]